MTSLVYNQLKEKYRGKKVLVVGLGLQGGGVGVAKFFSELGAYVIVTDKKSEKQLLPSIEKLKDFKNIDYHLGGHHQDDFITADIIFKGPSVPWDLPEIVEAQKKGVPIEMEMAFIAKYFPGKLIGITGTRGKSTTTNLIYQLLKNSGFNVFLGGGLPGISTIDYLKVADKNSFLVAELSSWALSGFHRAKISPHISVLTNLYPDHLNYYKNIDDYFYDKAAIFIYQNKNDFLVLNYQLNSQIKKFSPKSNIFYFSKEDFPFHLTYLKGDHNLENAASSLKVAQILEIDREKAIKIISNFNGLPYRQQLVGKKNNVIFINDTTSTTPIATIRAIDTFQDKKVVLILGGNSKNLPFDDLIKKLKNVEKIVLLAGSFTDQILDNLKRSYKDKVSDKIYDNLEKAVDEAYRLALNFKDSYVLFSPGATSFAMFNNEFHRGDEFNRIVKKIIS